MGETEGLPDLSRFPRLSYTYIRPPGRTFTFNASLLHAGDRSIVVADHISPSAPLAVAGEEVLADGYLAVWFLFKDEPWDVGRIYRPDGRWTGYYVDVLERVRWDGDDPSTLRPITDLFLDLWIEPDGNALALDEAELAEAERAGHVTTLQAEHAHSTLANLLDAIHRDMFPPRSVAEFDLASLRPTHGRE